MSVTSQICTGCARDGLDTGRSFGPGDIIALVDSSDCKCSEPGCDHIDHENESGKDADEV